MKYKIFSFSRLLFVFFGALSFFYLSGCALLGDKDNSLKPTPLTSFSQTISLKKSWQQSVGQGADGYYFRLSPAVANQMVFAPGYRGTVVALDAQTGQVVWQRALKKTTITSGAEVGDGAVYVGTGGAEVYALSMQDGHTLWHQTVNNEMIAPPKYANHTVIVETLSGSLIALSSEDGHRIWQYDAIVPSLILHAAGQPQVSGNTVVAGFSNGELIALDLRSGHVIWDQHVAYPAGDNPVSQMVDITVTPVIIGNTVYAATYQGKIAGYNLITGNPLWDHKISTYAGITGEANQIFAVTASSRVIAFNRMTGGVLWRQEGLRGRNLTGPALFSGALYVADGYGYLHALSLQDGRFLGRIDLGRAALTAPISYQNKLYIYTQDGYLIALQKSEL